MGRLRTGSIRRAFQQEILPNTQRNPLSVKGQQEIISVFFYSRIDAAIKLRARGRTESRVCHSSSCNGGTHSIDKWW
jgi:hypothetical protein